MSHVCFDSLGQHDCILALGQTSYVIGTLAGLFDTCMAMAEQSAAFAKSTFAKSTFTGGENGFLKRPGMVDEYDQQVSASMDGKAAACSTFSSSLHPICSHAACAGM